MSKVPELNYQKKIERSQMAFMLLDSKKNIIEANQTACELFEYRINEITKAPVGQLILSKRSLEASYHHSIELSEGFHSGVGIKKSGNEFTLKYQSYFLYPDNDQPRIALKIINQGNDFPGESPIEKSTSAEEMPVFQFDQLFFKNPSPGWIVDYTGFQFLAANQSAIDKYGYAEHEFLNMTLLDILPEGESRRLNRILEENSGLESAYSGHWENILKDGTLIHVEIPSGIVDANGRIIILGMDITERILSEEQIKYEAIEKEALYNSTQDQIWSLGRDFTLLAANKSFIKLLETATGITFKPGCNFMDHSFTKDFVRLWHPQYERALTGERVKEIVFIPESSNLPARWVELMVNSIIKNNEIIGVVCYTRNVTDTKVAEHRLIESEANLKEAQRLAKLGNWSKNIKTNELFWSDQIFEIFEIKKTDPYFKLQSVIYLIDKSDRKKVISNYQRTIATGQTYSIHYHITTPAGTKKIIEEIGYGQKDEKGIICRIFGSVQDITKSMLTEEALKLSYEKYHLVAKATNDGIWDWNITSGRVSRIGDGFKLLFGYENDFANNDQIIYDELIHPEDAQFVIDSQLTVLNDPKENYWEARYRFLKANGQYAYVFDRGYILRDAEGKPLRMIGASQDVTIQTEQLKEITRIQGDLHALINTTKDLIWSFDTEFKIITTNKVFKNILKTLFNAEGFSEGDQLLNSVFGEQANKYWRELYNRALSGESFEIEFEYDSPIKNKWRYSIVSFSPIVNKEEKITGVACFAKDITDLKISAEELIHSQKRFRDLFHLSPQPMWLYENRTLEIVEINQSAIDHYGYSEKEFLCMTILDIRPKKNIKSDLRIIKKRRSSSKRDFNQKFQHLKKNGEIIEVQIFSTPIEIEKKKHTLVIAIDNTEKTKFEHNINKAIIQAQENERYEIGSELHDNICQLLASSKMRLSILKEYIPNGKMFLFEESNQYLINALDEIRNLSHRLAPSFFNDQTLEEAFSRLFNSINFLDKFDIELHFCENVGKQNISIELKLNLYRILQEQLRNILKYAQATKIILEVKAIENTIMMRTIDNGIGFNLTKIKSGIGLSNIKRRVELFSGKLDINTSPGKGTEILIIIPVE